MWLFQDWCIWPGQENFSLILLITLQIFGGGDLAATILANPQHHAPF
jgi:hypothetical protein